MNTLILGGGEIEKEFALEIYQGKSFEWVIAVDGGLYVADALNICPTDIVGDFDTVDAVLLAKYEKNPAVEIRRFQPEKDATDSQIAMELAIAKGSAEIVFLGATGSRIDHMMGNITLLSMALEKQIPCCIWDSHNRIRLLDKPFLLKREEKFGTYVSLLPFSERVNGITLKGFRYPLSEYLMDKTYSLTIGISNELKEDEGEILFREGVLILIESRD